MSDRHPNGDHAAGNSAAQQISAKVPCSAVVHGIADTPAEQPEIAEHARTPQKKSKRHGKSDADKQQGTQPHEDIQRQCTDCGEPQFLMQCFQLLRLLCKNPLKFIITHFKAICKGISQIL